jgi:hypothetical protein
LAGVVKDLIKAGRVKPFGMSEAAAGTVWSELLTRLPAEDIFSQAHFQ